ncbi:endonuclease III [Hydrogenivirga sp. 128-5-R1-1]|uniref:endonuclease III domain-containing protein n=1 Tax=Hydrogenivirga sp. 128-5-R1-1 TaxID=392423 RepID=UPI00015F3761|nr:endonuclease III [Hydrogenivirga sp. 128-5-R1-1]EDP76681.1 endonuclease III [Hydrogenivirga sp. 128-5-R1-1]
MNRSDIPRVIEILKEHYERWEAPVVTLVAQHTHDPFKVLICALLSTRTRDETTAKVCEKFFKKVKSPEDILKLPLKELEELIYPVGFYRNKAKQLKKLAEILIRDFGGEVPKTREELLRLPGVGRKVANLVLADGYSIPAICVDTHVHRITNRWCLVKTRTPEETEKKLMEVLPEEYWIVINRLLVAFGQRICTPQRPRCGECPIENFCGKCL